MGFDMDPSGAGLAAQLWTLANSGAAVTSPTPFGTGYSWQLQSGATCGLTFGVNLVTLIQGVRLYISALPATSAVFLTWYDATAGAAQVTLRVFNDGSLRFYLGTGTGTPLGSASATGIVTVSTWIYFETKVTIDGAAGVVECRINGSGTPAITASSLNTKSTANTWVSAMEFTNPSSVAFTSMDLDDWYMLDTTAASPLNTYLGNVQVKGDKPTGNSAVGGRNAFTHTNPTNVNYTNVGNIPYSASEYNADATPGDFDMFGFGALSATTVLFLNEWAVEELDAAGARTISLDCYSGGTDDLGTAFTPSAGTPTLYNQPYLVDPNTSAAWTVANAQAAELGVKIVS